MGAGSPLGAPRLTTERLVLVPLDDSFAAEHDPVECELAREHWSRHGFGHWAVLEEGRFVGVAEVHLAHPGVEGISAGEVEVGWSIASGAQGRGLATEAMRAAIVDAWARTGADHLVAYIRPENAASRRVAAKLGLRVRGPGRARSGDPVDVYELRP